MMVNIIVAFKAEARPIIEHFSLVKLSDQKMEGKQGAGIAQRCYEVYGNERIQLLISGMGIENARLATQKMLAAKESNRWLNFGVAGSAGYSVGEMVWASRVIEDACGTEWVLPQFDQGGIPCATLSTVNRPQTQYRGSIIYDMEAAGIAQRLSEAGKLHQLSCLKIISDGPDNISQLTLKGIRQLLSSESDNISSEVERFIALKGH